MAQDADDLPGEVYSLCEAVADLSASFITAPVLPNDSREMNRLCIMWAQEFEEKNQDVSWGVDEGADYIEAIDAFFDEKYKAWRETAVEVRPNDMIADPGVIGTRSPASLNQHGEAVAKWMLEKHPNVI